MASTNKTIHYELSQYVSSDKPTYLGDYNGDMLKIDTGINAAKVAADEAQLAADDSMTVAEAADTKANNAVTASAQADVKATTAVTNMGNLSDLQTTAKTNLVAAINEVNSKDSDLIGAIVPFANATAAGRTYIENNGYLYADGRKLVKTEYPRLYSYIGNIYNTGDEESDEFRIPDYRDLFLLGTSQSTQSDINQRGGEAAHTLTINEIPAHVHPNSSNFIGNAVMGGEIGNREVICTGGGVIPEATVTGSIGGGQSHNNMPPYRKVAFYIKAK